MMIGLATSGKTLASCCAPTPKMAATNVAQPLLMHLLSVPPEKKKKIQVRIICRPRPNYKSNEHY